MYYPTDYTLVVIADGLIGWLFVGFVYAALIRPSVPEPTTA
ncbi:MAG: hypothetical protein ACF8PN_13285 [Phycisphaerales bacterium]